jgi:hypothetical protein
MIHKNLFRFSQKKDCITAVFKSNHLFIYQ